MRPLADAFGLTGDARDTFCQAADGAPDRPSVARVAAQLPPDVYPFTGRAQELARLDALLAGPSERPWP